MRKINEGLQWTGWLKDQYGEPKAQVYFLGSIKLRNGRWKPVGWAEPLCRNEKELKVAKKAIIKAISDIMEKKVWPHKGKNYKFSKWKPLVDKDLKRL